MKKRGFHIVLLAMLFISLLSASIIAYDYSSVYNVGSSSSGTSIIDGVLGPIMGGQSVSDIYNKFPQIFDLVFLMFIFIPLSMQFLGERLGKRPAGAVGALIPFMFVIYEGMNGFNLGKLGPFWAVIVMLIFGAAIFWTIRGVNGRRHNFNAFAISLLLMYMMASAMIPVSVRDSVFNRIIPGFPIWMYFQLITLIVAMISLVRMFMFIFTRGFRGRNMQGVNNLLGATGRVLGEGLEDAGRADEADRIRNLQNQIDQLQRIIENIEREQSSINITNMQDIDFRINVLNQVNNIVIMIGNNGRGRNSPW